MPRTPSAIGWAFYVLAIPAIASAQSAPEPTPSEPVAIAPSLLLPTVATFEEEAWAPAVTAQPAPPRDRYPRSLAVRKPILPPGVVEASALFGVEVPDAAGDRARYTALPRVRLGIPHAEVAVASAVVMHAGDLGGPAPERLGMVSAYGRYMFVPGATVGAELTVRTPLDDAHRYQPRVTAGMKQRFGTRAAIDALVAGGIDEAITATARTRSLAALGTLRLQAQLAHGLAFEARGSLGYTRPMPDDPVMPAGGTVARDFGVRMVAGATPTLDFIVGFDALGAGATASKVVTAGLAVRRLP